MDDFVSGLLGLVHTLSAAIALISGLVVLSKQKGTRTHRKVGYTYFFSMIILNVTAIPITNMSGTFGFFHVFILISLPTTILGLYIPLFSRHKRNWVLQHFSYMFWSYVGLIAAFIAEVMVRLPVILANTEQQVATESLSAIGIMLAFAIMGAVMFFAELIFRRWRSKLNVG